MVYIRDCYDHVIQLTENVDTGLDACSALRDFHFNAVNNRTNEVMKTLTIISTIFIPLGFLAGVYGMNFEYLPGTRAHNGFFLLLIAMVAIVIGLLAWFRQRGWFEKPT